MNLPYNSDSKSGIQMKPLGTSLAVYCSWHLSLGGALWQVENYRGVQRLEQAMATLEDATRKSGFANDHLKDLPENGEGVADVADRLKQANSKLQLANTNHSK